LLFISRRIEFDGGEGAELFAVGLFDAARVEAVTVMEIDERREAGVIDTVAAEALEELGGRFVRVAFMAGGGEAFFEFVVFAVAAGPVEIFLRAVAGFDAVFAEENSPDENGDERQDQVGRDAADDSFLAEPAPHREFEPEVGEEIGDRFEDRGLFFFGGSPGARRGVDFVPLIVEPGENPGVRVTFADDVGVAFDFLERIADGVTRGNAKFAKEKRGGGREIFAVAAARIF
jgi:hypothetical protein